MAFVTFNNPPVRHGDIIEFPVARRTRVGNVAVFDDLVFARTRDGAEFGPLMRWRLLRRLPDTSPAGEAARATREAPNGREEGSAAPVLDGRGGR